jgi:ribosome-binding protein aMBF1 (putative translation factor)
VQRQCLPQIIKVRSESGMDEAELAATLDRAERALRRIEEAIAARKPTEARDDVLRARVREVVEELDGLIRAAAA